MIEGLSLSSAGAFGDDEDEGSDVSSSEDDDDTGEGAPRVQGTTYHVGGGVIKKLEGGVGQYVKVVERKLEKRAKKAGG